MISTKSALSLPLGFAVFLAGCSSDAAEGSGREGGAKGDSTKGPDPVIERPYKDPKELMKPPADSKPVIRKQTEFAKDLPDLKIKVQREAKADAPVLEYDNIGKFHLVITLSNGNEVDNTRKVVGGMGGDPQPRMFLAAPQEKLKGLGLAVVGMKEGEVRVVIVPAELGFGEEGDYIRGIPENATLTVRAELMEVVGPMVRIWKEGAGDAIQRGQTGRFHYTGVLAKDGTKFDSSRDDPKKQAPPMPLEPNSVIEGWVIGLSGMKVGERRWVCVPSPLAYGAQGRGPQIRPHYDLIFEAELVEILPN